jgi:diguanylate cyclase (GGDEF)-like protein
LRILDLQDRLIRARESLREQALRDPLTGLWNRRAILDTLQKEVDRWRRSAIPLAILIIDVDHFKRVNDTYGHLVGDRVLQEVVDRIGSSIRSYDALGRFGGEEFLVVLPGTDARLASEIGDRLRNTVAAAAVPSTSGNVAITVSLGCVALGEPDTGTAPLTAEDLLHCADAALYRAKAAGRNRIETAIASHAADTNPPSAGTAM